MASYSGRYEGSKRGGGRYVGKEGRRASSYVGEEERGGGYGRSSEVKGGAGGREERRSSTAGGGGGGGGIHMDDEWEREGLLDPAWERQQKKTFTAWCNSHLRKADTQIETLEEDFRDGLRLLVLLEVISGEQLSPPERGRMRFHKIANVNKSLDFIESKGVRLVSIGAEEIVDGNLKMTLGMIWTIILRFAIQNIAVEDMTAKEGLLLWCQRKTAPYKNVHVANFHSSFQDGLAFCALIHRHRPDLLSYKSLSKDQPIKNLNLAFEVAERYLDIPRMIDVEDMSKPDERSVMAYVSSYYHAFSGAQQATTAANRIARVITVRQENESLIRDYETLASDLLSWIARVRPWLENRDSVNTLSIAQTQLDKFRDYRSQQKPPKLEEKAQLETTFNTLQTRLRLANRPAYWPTEGQLVGDINAAWKGLENAEKGFEDWLLRELQRLQRIQHLIQKFKRKCASYEDWVEGKEEMLLSDDHKQCRLNEVKVLKRKHEAFDSDLCAHQDRVEQIAAIAQELNTLCYYDVKATNARCAKICAQWDRLGDYSQTRRTLLEESERVLERVDQLQLEFAKRATLLNNWLEGTKDDLEDLFIVHSISELRSLQDSHEDFKSTLGAAGEEEKNVISIQHEINRICQQYHLNAAIQNPYTPLVEQDITSKWNDIQSLVPARDRLLHDEMNRQLANETLRQEFAERANIIGPWLEECLDSLSADLVSSGGSVKLESHLSRLKSLQREALVYIEHMKHLEQINQRLVHEMILENRHTVYTMETLRVGYEQLLTSIARNINEIENEILLRDSKGIDADQLEEFRRSFLHFDKSRTRRLEPKEFKACLVSLGYSIKDDKQGEVDFERILATVDPNHLGYVSFDSFLDFMTRETMDADSAEQIVQSFRVLAEDKPYITVERLRAELPTAQADYCIRHMPPYLGRDAPPNTGGTGGGALDYTTFTQLLYSGSTDL